MACFKRDRLDCECPVECPKVQLTKERRYTWMNSSGCIVSRPLTNYECQLEDEVQKLQDALFSLSSHYAKIQFRLRQIATASGYEQECLLRELERVTCQGIDDRHNELPNLLSDSHRLGNVRGKQHKIISDIRSRLTNLAEVTDVCFCAESESSYNLRRHHQRELDEAPFEETPLPATEEHEKNCSCVVCQERLEEKCKVPAYERGFLSETWPNEDCIEETQTQTKQKKKKSNKYSLEKLLIEQSSLLNPSRTGASRTVISSASGKKGPKEVNSMQRNSRISGVQSARSLNRTVSVNSKSKSKSNQEIKRQNKSVVQKPPTQSSKCWQVQRRKSNEPQKFSPRNSRMQNALDAAEAGEKCVPGCKCPGSKRMSQRDLALMQNYKTQMELKKSKSRNRAQGSKLKNDIEGNTETESTRRCQSCCSNPVEYKTKNTNMNGAKDTNRFKPQSCTTLYSGNQVEHKGKTTNFKKAKESPRISPQGSEMQYYKNHVEIRRDSKVKSQNFKASCPQTCITICPGNQAQQNVHIKRSTRCSIQNSLLQYPDNQVKHKNKSIHNNSARESPRSSSPSPRIQSPPERVEQTKSLKASKSTYRAQSNGQSTPPSELMQCDGNQDACEISKSSIRSKESQQRPAKRVQYQNLDCDCESDSELSSGCQNHQQDSSQETVHSRETDCREGDTQVPRYNCALAEMSTCFVHKRNARTLCDERSCTGVCSKTCTCWDQLPDESSKKPSKKELKTCDKETCAIKQAKRQAKKKPEKKESKKDLKSKSMTMIPNVKPLTPALKPPRNFVESQKNSYLIYPNVPAKYGSPTKEKCGRRFCRLFCNKLSRSSVDPNIKKKPDKKELKLSESLTNPCPQTSNSQGRETVLQELKSRFRAKESSANEGGWRLVKL
ncbi:probable replication factor C subunit 1 [Drosophila virilis]|uniref:Uncharacterized protein, isoform A n=1 Tax=Drosophila virilis TaxID=7244 RepID=B4LDN8_DROVI|nr:uncharacterized protein LOC6624684 [Drosophila virilis]XP_032291015.1 uncharacterized protein LOC6624684 [Drosophila virilis]EDW69999.2 uncharacterized protein Dvir_GJ13557, isoform A [Drosophila virilis]KRF84665.1 uncharacterized protein Dvir_GJ13557, isoform B [Drosophila virilis]